MGTLLSPKKKKEEECMDEEVYAFAWGDNSFSQAPGIVAGQWNRIAAGPENSFFVRNGKLWAMGTNNTRSILESTDSNQVISRVDYVELEVFKLRAVSCGRDHIAVIEDGGRVISWGATNEFGQVGHGKLGLQKLLPQVLSLTHRGIPFVMPRIRQVSCGSYHTMMLSETGELWACGDNSFGQLGVEGSPTKPFCLEGSLCGLPIREVSCGSSHTVCCSASGDAFSWGRNQRGALGLGVQYSDQKKVSVPTRVEDLQGPQKTVVAGGNHTAFLHRSGQVFLAGDNQYGQLGHAKSDVAHSHIPLELPFNGFNTRMRHCLLGEAHTILLTEEGELYAMGLNTEKQCGPGPDTIESPMLVAGVGNRKGAILCGLACGGRHNIAMYRSAAQPADLRNTSTSPTLVTTGRRERIPLNTSATKRVKTLAAMSDLPKSVKRSPDRKATSSQDAAGSFHNVMAEEATPSTSSHVGSSTDATVMSPVDAESTSSSSKTAGVPKMIKSGVNDRILFRTISAKELPALRKNRKQLDQCFVNPHIVNASFCFRGTTRLRLDVDALIEASVDMKDKNLMNAVLRGLRRIEANARRMKEPDQLRCLLTYLLLPIWGPQAKVFENRTKALEAHTTLCMCIALLPKEGRKALINIIRDECSASAARDRLIPHCVAITNLALEVSMSKKGLLRPLWESVLLLDIVWCGCKHWVQSKKILKTAFTLTSLQTLPPQFELELFVKHARKEVINVNKFVLVEWNDELANVHPLKCGLMLESQSFMSHPHLVSVAFKQKVLQAENLVQHTRSIHANISASLSQIAFATFAGQQIQINPGDIYFVVDIRRDHILEDAVTSFARAAPDQMRRPLKIRFRDEEGVDEGGVQREFFKLLMKLLFDANFGMFKVDDESRMLWFNPAAELLGVPSENYRLVGSIIGLAVYNNLPGLDVPFPSALFKKLKGESPTMEDLCELAPTYANSIDSLLSWSPSAGVTSKEAINEEFQSTFALDFTVTYYAAGTAVTVELGPNGGPDRPVLYESREEFCNLLKEYVFDASVKTMFDPFQEGFSKVCHSFVLDVLAWDDLQRIVRAEADLDFGHLRLTARYEGGFTASDAYIHMFWEILNSFDATSRKEFLAFVTGSEFAPIGGLSELKLVVQKNGNEPTRRLPTAHTCFNLILIPQYSGRAKLEHYLRLAIENSQGFGLQ
eukprot:GEMP01000919.1.p1 GENE.GEMP01000919.1~~GEMP01000919.1.p1  ORF type:complete len:1187 (+),score=222.50 GEMP01000919.1:256-3816(+)